MITLFIVIYYLPYDGYSVEEYDTLVESQERALELISMSTKGVRILEVAKEHTVDQTTGE